MASRQHIEERKEAMCDEAANLIDVLRHERSEKRAQDTVTKIAERLDRVVADVGILEREGAG